MKTQLFLKTALVAGLLAISGTSFAASTTVTTTFTGTIPSSCSVAPGTAGVLTIGTGGRTMDTGVTGRGTFTLTCTGTANMTIGLPVPAAGSILLTSPSLSSGSGLYAATAPGTLLTTPGAAAATSQSSGVYKVDMGYSNGPNGPQLPTGDYSSSVTTTITPN